MFYVYVLKSLETGSLYTGSTNNVVRRLDEHNSGKSKATKHGIPYELVYTEEYKTRPEAYRREMFFKTGRGRVDIKRLIKDN